MKITTRRKRRKKSCKMLKRKDMKDSTVEQQLKSEKRFMRVRPYLIILALGITLLPALSSVVVRSTGEIKKDDVLKKYAQTEEYLLSRDEDINKLALQNDGDIVDTMLKVNSVDKNARERYIESKLLSSSNTELKTEYQNAQAIIKVGKDIAFSIIPCLSVSTLGLILLNSRYENYKVNGPFLNEKDDEIEHE